MFVEQRNHMIFEFEKEKTIIFFLNFNKFVIIFTQTNTNKRIKYAVQEKSVFFLTKKVNKSINCIQKYQKILENILEKQSVYSHG